jgi:uncharacterized protein
MQAMSRDIEYAFSCTACVCFHTGALREFQMIRWRTPIIIAFLLALGAGSVFAVLQGRGSRVLDNPAITNMRFEPYAEQKAVYHVMTGGGFRDRNFRNLLLMANNHMAAVGEGWFDLRILLQGDGVDLLMAARSNPAMAAQIDSLKKRGVKFVVCWNTLIQRGLDPDKLMHGVKREDIVEAGMAEATALAQKGYIILRP